MFAVKAIVILSNGYVEYFRDIIIASKPSSYFIISEYIYVTPCQNRSFSADHSYLIILYIPAFKSSEDFGLC